MTTFSPTITLNNGIEMPQLGLGVWKVEDGDEVETAVSAAIDTGYRLIDTAALYGNEAGVGRAIAASNVPREELFITTKLWNSDQGYDATLKAFDKSLHLLGLEYIDLYLIHWPMPKLGTASDTWRAFEKLYADKKIRAIGVSNFTPEHLEQLINDTDIVPAVNQIELHPLLQQIETRNFCKENDIHVESWSPLGGSEGNLLQNDVINEIAEKHTKTVAQIVIRWHIQSELIVIPKSIHPGRIAENFNVFDFELDDEDMHFIHALNDGTRMGPDPDAF